MVSSCPTFFTVGSTGEICEVDGTLKEVDGASALADAIRENRSLTVVDLSGNKVAFSFSQRE